jgi:hypothetical protein
MTSTLNTKQDRRDASNRFGNASSTLSGQAGDEKPTNKQSAFVLKKTIPIETLSSTGGSRTAVSDGPSE